MISSFLENLVFFADFQKINDFPRWEHQFWRTAGKRLCKMLRFSKEIVKIPNLSLEARFGGISEIRENHQGFMGFREHEVFPSSWRMSKITTFLTRKWTIPKKWWKNMRNHRSAWKRPSHIRKRNVFCTLFRSQGVSLFMFSLMLTSQNQFGKWTPDVFLIFWFFCWT